MRTFSMHCRQRGGHFLSDFRRGGDRPRDWIRLKRTIGGSVKRCLGSPAPSKGFYVACEDINASRRVVLYPGAERFKLDAKTEVMPLSMFLTEGFSHGPSKKLQQVFRTHPSPPNGSALSSTSTML